MFGILCLFFKKVVPAMLIVFLACRGIVLWNETSGGFVEKSLACLNNYKQMGIEALGVGLNEFRKAEKIVLNSNILRSEK